MRGLRASRLQVSGSIVEKSLLNNRQGAAYGALQEGLPFGWLQDRRWLEA